MGDKPNAYASLLYLVMQELPTQSFPPKKLQAKYTEQQAHYGKYFEQIGVPISRFSLCNI